MIICELCDHHIVEKQDADLYPDSKIVECIDYESGTCTHCPWNTGEDGDFKPLQVED